MGGDLWRLALIVDTPDVIKVASAFYALNRKHRKDIERLAELSGVTVPILPILARLDAAGLLMDSPPDPLIALIEEWVESRLDKMK